MKKTEGVYNAEELAALLKVSKSMAYKTIKQLNALLIAQNYIVVSGRVSCSFANEKLGL